MRKILLLLLGAICFKAGFAQSRFGNEWINFSQDYYKIKIAKEGIYRINHSSLIAAGINVSAIDPNNFQIWNLGIEQFIRVQGAADNSFDTGDYIEFFGKPNDGNTDRDLYQTPQQQPHTYFSLYTDTSVYYLTWTLSTKGKRWVDFSQFDYSNYPVEPYFSYSAVNYFTESYYEGKVYNGYGVLSEYTEGEGWFGTLFRKGQSQLRDVNTPFLYPLGPNPHAEILYFGKSDVDPVLNPSFNHHMQVAVSADNINFRNLTDTFYKGYTGIKSGISLNPTDIGSAKTRFRFSILNDLGVAADNNCIAYVKVTYPRTYNLGGNSVIHFNLSPISSLQVTYFSFANYPALKSSPVILDLTNNTRVQASVSGGTLHALIPYAGGSKEVFVCDSTDISVVQGLTKVIFQPINLSQGYDYLIVTHSHLLTSANQYAAFRNNSGFKPLVISTDQLYEQFYYGIHHPLAIRRFCNYLLENNNVKPENLLLLGKGQMYYSIRFSPSNFHFDYVPPFGNPASDMMYTSGLNGTVMEPAISTGRIPATTNQEVLDYLQKLKDYESNSNRLWQKNILHLSGGRNSTENHIFTAYLNGCKGIADKPFTGASVKTFSKEQSLPVSSGLKTTIQQEINKGIGLLTYFGHGASDILEIDFGGPEELANTGKYPIMMFSGCVLGNTFTGSSLCEKFTFQPNLGTVGWIANTGYGFTSELDAFNRQFYYQMSSTNYGKPIGALLKGAIKTYQDPTQTNPYNLIHSRQFAFVGDPALHIFASSLPDFSIGNLSFFPQTFSANSDSFALVVTAINSGKAINDSIAILVKRMLPNNTVVNYPYKTIKTPYYADTLLFWFNSKDQESKGLNRFEVTIDCLNDEAELDEGNNLLSIEYLIPAEGVRILYPRDFSIVNTSLVSFKVQPENLFNTVNEIIFQADTNPNFNSPWLQSSMPIMATAVTNWQLPKLPADSSVIFWRARLNVPDSLGGGWENGSFTYLPGKRTGWSQKHYAQISKSKLVDLSRDSLNRKFIFNRRTSVFYSVTTTGQDLNGPNRRTFNINYWPSLYGQIGDGIAIMAFNPNNEERWSTNSQFNSIQQVPDPFDPQNLGTVTLKPSGSYWFNTNQVGNPGFQWQRDSLIKYILSIPDGFHVFVHNGRNTGIRTWDTALINTFQRNLGSKILPNLKEGHPYYLISRKNPKPDETIFEETADTLNQLLPPPFSQTLTKFTQFSPLRIEGQIQSVIIGPTTKWYSAHFQHSGADNLRDYSAFRIFGIEKSGNEVLLFDSLKTDSIDLRGVDPLLYPNLRIIQVLKDDSLRTPLDLKHWLVFFDQLPEATINPSLTFQFHGDTMQQGDTLQLKLAYQNIGTVPMDSITIETILTDNSSNQILKYLSKHKALKVGDSLIYQLLLPTKNLVGKNRLTVFFNPRVLAEENYSNNVFQKDFFVIQDKSNPLLDVLFDGVRIANFDIVSAKPHIQISLLDNNKFLLLKDTSLIKISLSGPSGVQQINFNRQDVIFNPSTVAGKPAIIEYSPDSLTDGIYTLTVSGRDVSGNYSGRFNYEIKFEVINKSTITYMYPYPNPFTTTMRFVFTLTGSKVPDYMKIQITNINGRVVKTIDKNDLGTLHIGNNITDVIWDGTDEFGDRLANGVYLFKVITRTNGQGTEHRASFGDEFYRQQTGKIYLLR